jgi:hypothetical protein
VAEMKIACGAWSKAGCEHKPSVNHPRS